MCEESIQWALTELRSCKMMELLLRVGVKELSYGLRPDSCLSLSGVYGADGRHTICEGGC